VPPHLTDLDKQGRNLVSNGQEAGMTVTIDKIGSGFHAPRWRNKLPPIMTCSHIDTQPTGAV
jgi:hypothetical protein